MVSWIKSLKNLLKGRKEEQASSTDALSLAQKVMENMNAKEATKTMVFAGQRVQVTSSKKRGRIDLAAPEKPQKTSALDALVGGIEKKKKISAVEKSSYDWDKFKEKEKIADELEEYTKNGYVEKQAFMNRVDLRKFEQEKAQRERERMKRAANQAGKK